ncbi:MAG: chemotaxis protein CheD [Sideroxydans sp.]|nr:chemotaxis protein CheD [Sideroxydans sp.]
MKKPGRAIEVTLQPGEFYFGDGNTRIRTLLGSCIAITMWHPQSKIGGMCHFMLPSRSIKPKDVLDGRYADEAMQLFLREIRAAFTKPGEYQVKLFGGGNMFDRSAQHDEENCKNIPCHNVAAARRLLQQNGFHIVAEHVGMSGHRNVVFDIWNGNVWLRHVKS